MHFIQLLMFSPIFRLFIFRSNPFLFLCSKFLFGRLFFGSWLGKDHGQYTYEAETKDQERSLCCVQCFIAVVDNAFYAVEELVLFAWESHGIGCSIFKLVFLEGYEGVDIACFALGNGYGHIITAM